MAKMDYYSTLGTPRTATADDLHKAYRKLAMQHHPDRNPGDETAEARFTEIAEAYEVLKDDQKRAAYDRFRHAAFETGTPTPQSSIQEQNDARFQGVLATFPHNSSDVPPYPQTPALHAPALSESVYYEMIVEGLSRPTRAAAERFFTEGGYGPNRKRAFGDTEYRAILTRSQIAACMQLWNERATAALLPVAQAHLERAQAACQTLTALADYLRIHHPAPAGTINAPLVHIGKEISRMAQPDILCEPQYLNDWRLAIQAAEQSIIYYAKRYPGIIAPNEIARINIVYGNISYARKPPGAAL